MLSTKENTGKKDICVDKRKRIIDGSIVSNFKGKRRRSLQKVARDFNDLELKFFVIRQANLKNARDTHVLIKEEDRVIHRQDALLCEASEMEIKSLKDVSTCFSIWHAEIVKTRSAANLKPLEIMMRNAFMYLRQQNF